MVRHQLTTGITFCVLLGLTSSLVAQDGFRLPNLNPFAKPEQTRSVGRLSDEPTSSMPKLQLPKLKMPQLTPERQPGQPGTMQRISQSTKGMLTKTRDTLMPWAKPKQKANPKRRGGITVRMKEEKKPFFQRWFGGKDEPKPVKSVNDFLELPVPK